MVVMFVVCYDGSTFTGYGSQRNACSGGWLVANSDTSDSTGGQVKERRLALYLLHKLRKRSNQMFLDGR
jgi:hypothetical protein